MIEFSDYIAISVPELRAIGKKNHCERLTNYIKSKKPSIDIHLLGCTELKLRKSLGFATSSDSTSYLSGNKYGYIKGRHINGINQARVMELVSPENLKSITDFCSEKYATTLILNIYQLLKSYEKAAGSQD